MATTMLDTTRQMLPKIAIHRRPIESLVSEFERANYKFTGSLTQKIREITNERTDCSNSESVCGQKPIGDVGVDVGGNVGERGTDKVENRLGALMQVNNQVSPFPGWTSLPT